MLEDFRGLKMAQGGSRRLKKVQEGSRRLKKAQESSIMFKNVKGERIPQILSYMIVS